MRTVATKQDIIKYLRQKRDLFDQLVVEVGTARMSVSGAMGRWTFKDLIAHLTGWWRRELGCLEAIRRGEPPMPHPQPSEVQLINNWIYHTQHDRPLEQLLNDVDEVWRQFEASINSMSEHELMSVGHYPRYDQEILGSRILSDFVDHYHDDHERKVRTWLSHLTVEK
jgi:hypothetical protein